MKIPSKPRERGFTLIELLVVITIIAILASLGTGAGLMAIQKARKTTALASATAIETAVNNFYTEYGYMPKDGTADASTNTKTDTDLLKVLLGLDDAKNPRAIKFLNAKQAKNDKDGIVYDGDDPKGLYDPWGGPFYVEMDLDYDESVTPSPSAGGGKKLNGRRAAVWSNGADGVKGGGKALDDVKTWQ